MSCSIIEVKAGEFTICFSVGKRGLNSLVSELTLWARRLICCDTSTSSIRRRIGPIFVLRTI